MLVEKNDLNVKHFELSQFYEKNKVEEDNESVFSTSQDDQVQFHMFDFQELLKNILRDMNEQYQIDKQIELSQMINKNETLVTIPKNGIKGLCGINIDIIRKKDQITLKSYLVKPNFQPYYASNKNQINVLSFHALKLNDKTEQGSYSIDPFTGLFSYKTVLQLSFVQMIKLNQQSLKDYFENQFKIHENNMRKQAPKLLFLMNKIGFTSMLLWIQKLLNFEKVPQFSQVEKFQDIKNIEIESDMKNKENESDLKLEQLYKDIKLIVKQKMFKVPDQKIDAAAFENIPKPKSLPLFSQINVEKNNKTEEELIRSWREKSQLINQGGYSEIRKETIYFSTTNNQTLQQKRSFAVKFDREQAGGKNEKKVAHEIKILNALKVENQQAPGSAYITSTYIDENLKNCYFMEFYNNGSLEQFISQKNITLSLRTKLFLLAGIISGIDFIHSKQIVHLDIKLGNILIQKQLIPKICDFGEAQFISELKDDKKDYSRSMPFAAPELYNQEPITQAFDIYSFGMIFSILIFEEFPFEFNPNDYSNLENRYENKTYCIKRSFQYQLKQGPQKILKQCYKILIACLSPIPNERPQAKWILSAIWKMIHFLDAF